MQPNDKGCSLAGPILDQSAPKPPHVPVSDWSNVAAEVPRTSGEYTSIAPTNPYESSTPK